MLVGAHHGERDRAAGDEPLSVMHDDTLERCTLPETCDTGDGGTGGQRADVPSWDAVPLCPQETRGAEHDGDQSARRAHHRYARMSPRPATRSHATLSPGSWIASNRPAVVAAYSRAPSRAGAPTTAPGVTSRPRT